MHGTFFGIPVGAISMMAQLGATAALFSIGLKKRKHFILRACIGIVLYFLASLGFTAILLNSMYGLIPFVIYGAFFLTALFLFEPDAETLWFYALSVVAVQHMGVATADAVTTLFNVPFGGFLQQCISLLCFAGVVIGMYFLYGRKIKNIEHVHTRPLRMVLISSAIFMVVYVLRFFSLLYVENVPQQRLLSLMIHLYSVSGSFMCLFALHSANNEDTLKAERVVIEQLLRERETQMKFSKETVDLINMKCHDIRHQAQMLRENPAVRIDEAALLEMEEAANIYDSYARTGNEAMDTILTEKGVFCQSNGIPFNYIVDGGSLSALSTSDLCSLFGNILENAIEAELQQPVDKRLITLKVFRNRDYLCIHAENYCETLPEMKDDVPQTSKADKSQHGFGTKSILYITEKYGGHVSFTGKDHLFIVNIVIPLSA